jgi:hypothetical protein
VTRTELIIQVLKIAIGLAFGAYFVWWSLEVLDRLTPEDVGATPAASSMGGIARGGAAVAPPDHTPTAAFLTLSATVRAAKFPCSEDVFHFIEAEAVVSNGL